MNKKYNEIIIEGDIAKIICYCKGERYEVLIDAEDVDKVKDYRWCLAKGFPTTNIRVNNKKTTIKLNRFLLDCDDYDTKVIYKNENKLDNRKCNLKFMSQSEVHKIYKKVIDRTGESNHNKQGHYMTVINTKTSSLVDVYFPKFDLTYINRSYNAFLEGDIICPEWTTLEGERNININGNEMIIVKVNRSVNDLDVYFPKYNEYVKSKLNKFKSGKLQCDSEIKDIHDKLVKEHEGEVKYNNFGSKILIENFRSFKNIDILFPEYNWVAKNRTYSEFKKGNVACPYERRTAGVGYIGEGKYSPKNTPIIYRKWLHMLRRCKDDDKNCDEAFHCLQDFGTWYESNYYTVGNEWMDLDKDLFGNGSKIYSPNTCCFLPHKINGILCSVTKDILLKEIAPYKNKIPDYIYKALEEYDSPVY